MPDDFAGSSVQLVVDVSGSMSGIPLAQAQAALTTSVASASDSLAIGLRSYAGSCGDGGVLRVPVGLDNRTDLQTAIDALSAGGGTPTPDALRAAVQDLPSRGSRAIVLISDGASSCGPACPVAKELLASESVGFTAFTVGFNAPDNAEADLTCIAEATGGEYVSATDTDSLVKAIGGALGGPETRYVALGDSFSAGEGNAPYVSGTDVAEKNECHRSETGAYARAVPAKELKFGACSGAQLPHLTENLAWEGQWSDPPQLDAISPHNDPSEDTSLVTLTIGGNDAGFAPGLNACVDGFGHPQSGNCLNILNEQVTAGIGRITKGARIRYDTRSGSWRYCTGTNDCPSLPAKSALRQVAVSDLAGMLGKIRDRAPNARILVLLYPHLFPEDPPEKCIVGQAQNRLGHVFSYTVDRRAANRMNQLTDDVDAAIMDEVRQAKARGINADYVETRDAFYGHAVSCIDDPDSINDPWIRGLEFESGAFVVSPDSSSFHPNTDGQDAFAKLVNEARSGD